jgi:hypothetical protein
MRKLLTLPLLASCLATGCASTGPQIRHVVLFKYKASATPQQVETISAAFADLQHKIPGIVDYEAGTNCSPESHSKGLTHAYVLTFTDAAARDAYLPHPDHKAFGKMLGPILDDVCVVDYEVK